MAQKNKSIEDVLKLLLEIAGTTGSWGSRELARALHMDPTRTNRFLRTLTDTGFLIQDEQRKYSSGPGMKVLAAQSIHGSKLLRCSLPVIENIGFKDHIVALGTLHLDKVCYLYHGNPGMSFAEGVGRSEVLLAETSSIGVMMLSGKSDDEVRDIYRTRPVGGYFGNIEKLLEKLAEVREKGYCVIDSSSDRKYVSMAVTVGRPALGALAFSSILQEDAEEKIELLLQKAADIDYRIENTKMEKQRYVLQG